MRNWLIALFVLAVGGGAFWWFGLRPSTVQAAPVKTIQVKLGDVQSIVNAPGQIFPRNQTTVYTKNGGMVAKLLVKPGQEVEEGDVLLRFDTSALQTQVASLKTQLAAAEAGLKDLQLGSRSSDIRLAQDGVKQASLEVTQATRQLMLIEADYKLGVAAKLQVEAARNTLQRAASALESARLRATQATQTQGLAVSNAKAQLEAAKFQLKSLNEQIATAVVSSPMTGSVIELQVAKGQAVAASSAVAQIADLSSWVVQNRVAESDLPSLQVGMPVSIVVNAIGDTELEAKVIQMGQVQKFKDPLYYYQVDSLILGEAPEGLSPGLSTTATFVTEEASGVPLVPVNVLQSQNGKTIVEVKAGEEVRKVVVETGLDDGTNVEIKKGLKVGDLVVLPPPPGSVAPQNSPGGLGGIIKF